MQTLSGMSKHIFRSTILPKGILTSYFCLTFKKTSAVTDDHRFYLEQAQGSKNARYLNVRSKSANKYVEIDLKRQVSLGSQPSNRKERFMRQYCKYLKQ